jgi:hypothetical protein
MRYTIIQALSDDKLGAEVGDYTDAGWKPQGGVSVTPIPDGGIGGFCNNEPELLYSQALCHDGDNPDYPGIPNLGA